MPEFFAAPKTGSAKNHRACHGKSAGICAGGNLVEIAHIFVERPMREKFRNVFAGACILAGGACFLRQNASGGESKVIF